MNQKTIIILLFLFILLEVGFIIQNPHLFQQHYHILIIIPATAAAYLIVLYSQRKLSHMAKSNVLITPEQHRKYIDTEGVRLTNQLIASQSFEKIKAIKLGQMEYQPLSAQKQQQQEEIIQQIQDMEKTIFED